MKVGDKLWYVLESYGNRSNQETGYEVEITKVGNKWMIVKDPESSWREFRIYKDTMWADGKEVKTSFPTLDYHDIVWRVKGAQDKNIIYSVTYSMKNGISGILYPNGPSVELENGMVFNCFHTGNA